MDALEATLLAEFKEDVKKLFIRKWIQDKVKNYKEEETYIIYDGIQVEKYNLSMFNLKKRLRDRPAP